MHPLVRWQFVGGLKEEDRKAFLFTNIRDGKGRAYDIPVIVGGMAANREIYSTGMDCDLADIQHGSEVNFPPANLILCVRY